MSVSFATSFLASTLAGSGYLYADYMRCEEGEATVGLGLGLPTEVLRNSFGISKSTGLGIHLDFEHWDGLLVSPVPSSPASGASSDESSSLSSSPSMSEPPPMFETRRDRSAPPQDAFWNGYSSLRTSSPSVLFAGLPESSPDGFELNVSMLPAGFTLPSTESIASGLNLLSLDDEEVMNHIPSDESLRLDAGVGLGVRLAEMEGPELEHTLHELSLRDSSASSQ